MLAKVPVKWVKPNDDGYSWTAYTYIEEVAPSMRPGAPKHERETWFIVNLQPDGICMNCRKCRGMLFPDFGSYVCQSCLDKTSQAIDKLRADRQQT